MKYSEEKLLLSVLHGRAGKRPPFWFMRQAGRYLPEYRELRSQTKNFLSFCLNPEIAAKATLQPIERFGMDAAIIFSDILVVPHALGVDVDFKQGEGPVLSPVREADELKKLRHDRIGEVLAPVAETIKRVKASLPAHTALIGFAGAPWTLACYMAEGGTSRDFFHVKQWAYRDPEGFSSFIDILVNASIEYLSLQIEAGVEAVQLFDSWAGLLTAEEFTQWCIEPTARIVLVLRKRYPHIPVIGFPRGAGVLYKDYVSKTGIHAVSLDIHMPVQWAGDHIASKVAVQGNLDPILLATNKAKTVDEAKRLLDFWRGQPFIFNLGHGILPQTPVEHVAALVETIRHYG